MAILCIMLDSQSDWSNDILYNIQAFSEVSESILTLYIVIICDHSLIHKQIYFIVHMICNIICFEIW